jgi:hypothetical protein
MWARLDSGAAVNLDNVIMITEGNTAGQAVVQLPNSSSQSNVITFGTTSAEALAGIAKLTQAVDPAIYI